jgi:hypothetical protein
MKVYRKLRINIAFIRNNFIQLGILKLLTIYWHKFILKRILSLKLKSIIKKYYLGNASNEIDASKYLDLDTWVLENLGRIFQLGLNAKKGLSILDISTGCGYFPYIANYFGNNAEGTDLPDCEVYNETTSELRLKRQICEITAFNKIEIEGRYDLITGYMICFNNHSKPDLWHIDEWQFFLRNLVDNHLSQEGEIFFSFNPEKPEEPVSQGLLDYFSSKQAIVTLDSVFFDKNALKNI